MDATTLARLAEFEKDGKFYDALQYYRTKVTRSFRLKNANEVAVPLVKHALNFFFKEAQYQCAIDIGTQYAECLSKNNVELSDSAFDLLADIAAQFAKYANVEENAGNSQNSELLTAARRKFVDLSIQWTKLKCSDEHEKKYGSARLHTVLAKAYVKVGFTEQVESHFLLSDDCQQFVNYLRSVSTPAEYPIVNVVFQCLCLDRFPFAVALFNCFVSPENYPFSEPLYNFVHIFFDAIETENRAQFFELTETYKSRLLEIPAFSGYLIRIGKLYFGIRDNQCTNAGLGSLFSGLLGGQKEEETATSHISSRTPARTAPATSSAAPFSPFASFSVPTPPAPPKQQEVEEDLD